MKKIRFISWMFVFLVSMFPFAVRFSFAIETTLEDAVLKGNWEEVFERLSKDDTRANDPVARLIMAHACLATNRNSASMLLFLSVKEEKELRSWSEWAETLLFRNPQNPIALYLKADAKAREGRLDEAKEGFTQAIKIKEDFALAFNALGVVQALTNDWNNAQVSFYLAAKYAPDFADAYANLGTLGVLRETSLALDKGTLEAFNQALSISKEFNQEFALAYNGRGCFLFGNGRFEEAAQDFSRASQLSSVLVVAEINHGFATAYVSRLITLANMEKKPGTTLESINQQYPDILKGQHQQVLNMLPTQKDQGFWKSMDAFPTLSQNQLNTLIRDHGLQKVQAGALLKMQELKGQIVENYPKSRPTFTDKIAFVNDVSSFSFYSLGIDKNMRELWKEPFSVRTPERSRITSISPPPAGEVIFCSPGVGPSGAISPAGHIALSLGGGRVYEMPAKDISGKLAQAPRITTWDKLVQNYSSVHSVPIPDATPSDIDKLVEQAYEVVENPTGYYSEPYNVFSHNCIQSVKHLAQDVGLNSGNPNLKFSEHPWQFYTWLRIKDVPSLTPSQEISRLQQQSMAAGQLRNIDTKLDTLNAMSTVSPTKQFPSQVPGYYTSIDRPLTELSALASMVDKSIKTPMDGSARRALVVAQDSFRASLQLQELHQYGFETRVVPPSPDIQTEANKWGAGVILGIKGIKPTTDIKMPQIKTVPWDWGKPFTPTYPKGAPGGISTEELAKSFVDKGNWPVMTSFGLFYETGHSTKYQNEKGGE